VSDALYLPSGDPGVFTATVATQGPWDPGLQHGGAPAALLARAVEQQPGDWPFTVARMAVEILGPVPIGEVRVASRVTRPGRSVELVEAELSAGGRVAAAARAWRIRRTELDLPESVLPPTTPPPFPPDDAEQPDHWPSGFLDAMEMRFAASTFSELGPGTMWARLRHPLVDGEELTGLQRLMSLADCGNGVSNALPIGRWMFINPDLTVHLARYPRGEWLCIDAQTTADRQGFGVATSTLYDREGLVGHGAQSLLISRR
jgi:hypothetical protein